MRKEFNFDKINNYSNMYVSLASLLRENINEAILPMLKNIEENNKCDINETFFQHDGYEYIGGEQLNRIEEKNLFDVILSANLFSSNNWDTHFGSELVDFFIKNNVDFKHEKQTFFINAEKLEEIINSSKDKNDINSLLSKNSKKTKYSSSLFNGANEEIKKIKLFESAYSSMSFSEFNNLIKKYKVLHFALESKEFSLINFLVKDKKINIDLEDENKNTVLFYARDVESLKFIEKYQPNWFFVNAENKDCVNCFSKISDKEVSNKMISFAQNKMKENITKNGLSEDFITRKIKETLIDLINTDKNKKELVDYLKKNNLEKFDDIKDEKGNSIAQICLEKGNWARYEVFKLNEIDTNKDGRTELDILMGKKSVKREKDAKKVFDFVIKKGLSKYTDFSFNVLNDTFLEKNYYSKTSILPDWIFKDANNERDKEIGQLLEKIIEEKSFFIDGIKEENNRFNIKDGYSYRNERNNHIDIYFCLAHLLLCGKKKLTDLDINSVFIKQNNYYSKKDYLELDTFKFDKFISIIEIGNRYKFFENLNIKDFEMKIEECVTRNFIKEFYKSSNKKDDNQSFISFFNANKESLVYFFKNNNGIINELITDNFIDFLNKNGKDLVVMAQKIKLENDLVPKIENKNIKGMKI